MESIYPPKDTRVGIVVGRFQIDTLHDGHMHLLRFVDDTHSRMLVLVGVRPAEASDTHPLTFEDRRVMIQEKFKDAVILPVIDVGNDEVWSTRVDALIRSVYGYEVDAVFYTGRNSFAPHYTGAFTVETQDFGLDDIQARDVRNRIKDRTSSTRDARAGVIKAVMNQGHRTTMMVDMFMVRRMPTEPYNFEVLMGKKDGEDLWRLPGGRVEAHETFKAAASREMAEETGMFTPSGVKDWTYIGDFNVDDWRCRDTDQVSYKTVLMTAQYFSGKPEARDDLVDVTWINAQKLERQIAHMHVVKEHRELVSEALAYLSENPPSFIAE